MRDALTTQARTDAIATATAQVRDEVVALALCQSRGWTQDAAVCQRNIARLTALLARLQEPRR